jgi:hypothetical protein
MRHLAEPQPFRAPNAALVTTWCPGAGGGLFAEATPPAYGMPAPRDQQIGRHDQASRWRLADLLGGTGLAWPVFRSNEGPVPRRGRGDYSSQPHPRSEPRRTILWPE